MSKTTVTLAVTVAVFALIHYLCRSMLGYRLDALDSLMGRGLKYYADDYNRIVFRVSLAVIIVAVVAKTIIEEYTGFEILAAVIGPIIVFTLFAAFAIVLVSVHIPGVTDKINIVFGAFYLALFVNLRVLFSALAIPKTKGKGLFSFLKNLPEGIARGHADDKILIVIRVLIYLNWVTVVVSMVLFVLKRKELFMYLFGI